MLDSKSQRTTAYRIQRPIQQGCWHGSATAKAKRNRTEASHRPIRPCSSLAPSASSFFLSSMLTYAFSVSIFILILWLFLFTLSCCSFLSTPLRLPSLLLSLVFRSLSFSLSLSLSLSFSSFSLFVFGFFFGSYLPSKLMHILASKNDRLHAALAFVHCYNLCYLAHNMSICPFSVTSFIYC